MRDVLMIAETQVVTTPEIPGRVLVKSFGVVTAQAVLALDIAEDIAVAWRDGFGGRSGTLEQRLAAARTACLDDLRAVAARLGANGIVGLRLDLEVPTKSIVIMMGIGTAVRTERVDVAAAEDDEPVAPSDEEAAPDDPAAPELEG
jgi:uncharacterized protein YbjQ (UPF0145 family)